MSQILVVFRGPDIIDDVEKIMTAVPQRGDFIAHRGREFRVTKIVHHAGNPGKTFASTSHAYVEAHVEST